MSPASPAGQLKVELDCDLVMIKGAPARESRTGTRLVSPAAGQGEEGGAAGQLNEKFPKPTFFRLFHGPNQFSE